ncbi:hypothetical protein GWI33_004754, partial [Rhynchophorus ferrugineus]
NHRSIEQ